MSEVIFETSQRLGDCLLKQGATVTVAESCTGGALASAMTDVAGSSKWFRVGFITYANRYKKQLLSVPDSILRRDGAVSEAVVREMAIGAARIAEADYAMAISGIAGPGGGTTDKPVGTVWFAWFAGGLVGAQRLQFDGDRRAVRSQAVAFSLQQLLHLATESNTV